ncbi:MAG: class I SAM-dependent methyltransferase [Clostridia bacterium]
MILASGWKDYLILDTGDGEKLESWNGRVLRRPDPQVIWPRSKPIKTWEDVDARYYRSNKGGGNWEKYSKLPTSWTISYDLTAPGHEALLRFHVEPTGFKHTGIFPEQAANWSWMYEKITAARQSREKINVLNLFAYTGAATVACAAAGANVCHVDAAKGMVQRAKENLALSELADKPVRFIVDDVMKFVQREKNRGNQYDGIIMDPPSFGRGPSGEMWKLEEQLFALVDACTEVLSDDPLFFVINSYTTGLQPLVLSNILHSTVGALHPNGAVQAEELGIPVVESKIVLPCGATGRWSKSEPKMESK